MERSKDPAHVRVGVSMGSPEDVEASARLVATFHELLARSLNIARVGVLASPVLVQCCFLHQVDFVSWLLRLVTVYALIGGAWFLVLPEQLYLGMGLGRFRWLFERFHQGAAFPGAERSLQSSICGRPAGELHGLRVKLRWHSTGRYLCIDAGGWAVAGDEATAAVLLLSRCMSKEKRVPDTYTFRLCGPEASQWHEAWLSFRPVNHLAYGGWLGAFKDPDRACPYKLLQDSSCPSGAFKLLCAWSGIPPPAQRSVTGLYLAEQQFRGQGFVGHAPDSSAALLEAVLAE